MRENKFKKSSYRPVRFSTSFFRKVIGGIDTMMFGNVYGIYAPFSFCLWLLHE